MSVLRGAPATGESAHTTSSLVIAAAAAIAAGAIHATALGSHVDHTQVVVVFAVVTVFQIGWGAAILARPTNRALAVVGCVGSAALLAGWVLAKTRGIGFVDGLDHKEPVQLADGLCAGLAGVTMMFTAHSLAGWRLPGRGRALAAVAVVGAAVAAYPGMVNAAYHHHHDDSQGTVAAGDDHDHAAVESRG